jgi:hypothetical protein
MKLIGFNGSMGVGKSTAIKCLKDMLEDMIHTDMPQVRLVKFAQPLYDMQEFVYRRITSVHKRSEGFTKDRKLLQWLGTDWGRDTISKTLWVDIWKAEVRVLQEVHPNDIVVCDDIRFDNEAEAFKAMGGTLVKLVSTSTAKRIDIHSGISNHASEAGIDPKYVDLTIENNGTLLQFLSDLTNMYKNIGFRANDER